MSSQIRSDISLRGSNSRCRTWPRESHPTSVWYSSVSRLAFLSRQNSPNKRRQCPWLYRMNCDPSCAETEGRDLAFGREHLPMQHAVRAVPFGLTPVPVHNPLPSARHHRGSFVSRTTHLSQFIPAFVRKESSSLIFPNPLSCQLPPSEQKVLQKVPSHGERTKTITWAFPHHAAAWEWSCFHFSSSLCLETWLIVQ